MNKISRILKNYVSNKGYIKEKIKTKVFNKDVFLENLKEQGLISYCKKNKTYYRDIHGIKFHLMPHDTGISRALALNGNREEESVETFRRLVKPDMNIFDLGANIGFYVCLGAQILKNGKGKLYAIEPSPLNVNMVKINLKENNFDEFATINQGAISNETKKVKFLISSASNWNKLLDVKEKDNKGEIIEVNAYTVNDFFKLNSIKFEEIDFLRMDVEGAEYDFLPTIYSDLEKKEKFLMFIEFHPHINIKKHIKVLKHLEKLGFKSIDTTKEWSLGNGKTGRKHLPKTSIEELYSDEFLLQFGGVEVFLQK